MHEFVGFFFLPNIVRRLVFHLFTMGYENALVPDVCMCEYQPTKHLHMNDIGQKL